MTRELVDRMRTCAAAIEASKDNSDPWNVALIGDDAARLLRIAADELDVPEPIGEPMEVLRKVAEAQTNVGLPLQSPGVVGKPVWGGSLNASAAPCPACGSIDARTVKRFGVARLQLTCPSCQHQWEYGR